MSIKINKSLILNEIKSHYKIKSDAEFARFLEIKPQTLSSWRSRNTYDIDLLYAKCIDLNAEWLLTGKGPMLKEEASQKEPPKDRQKEIDRLLELLDQKDREIAQLKKAQENTAHFGMVAEPEQKLKR